ncbi:VWA domain-containing protein [Sporosarcina sp. FSL W7-1349]|uniref:VWA domain-containing protein n=1 Tax=Sporosarcina sp. FSL W7-1349 TaxID=2921561 RepID=UPI0030F5AA2E
MDIRIEEPYWLLLLIPAAIYMGFTWKTSGQRLAGKGTILFALRCLAIIALVFALTSPYLTSRANEEQILFVVDRSVSVGGAQEKEDEWIAESLKGRKENQSVGMFSFAGSFRTDVKLTDSDFTIPDLPELPDRDATDLAKAIDLAAAVAKNKVATRIVLLTDGLETVGSVEQLLPKYAGGRVQIDTVLLDQEKTADASIALFDTPKTAYEGEKQLLHVEVESSTRTTGELIITQNDEEIIRESVELEPGTNRFSFRNAASGKGLLKYEAKLIVPDDAILENNRMLAVTMLEQSPRVLIVQTERNPSAIPKLLDSQSIDVNVMNAAELPESLSGYLGYGAIIFDNVPGHQVGENKMTVIEQAVKKFGVGFMMVGGDESFGLGGYFKSPIERLLPVEMELQGKEQIPSLGLVIVMDRSGSMSGSKIVLAREAAARSVELLRDDDTFGFIAFDDQVWEVIPIGAVGSKEEAIEKILSVPANGGTDIFPGLLKAYEDLSESTLQRKHIILLTDGQSPMPPGYEELIEEGRNQQITLSTVAIGEDADWTLLEELAEEGGGRFYDVIDESTVPAILTRETSMMTRTYIEDDPFYMTVAGVPLWSSLFEEGVPKMNAYIATTPKQTATIVAESHKQDPILAEWMYGLGRTIAFTSDATGKWSGDLARWANYPEFWNTAAARLLPSYREVPYIITHEGGGTYTVTDSSRKAAFLDVAVVDESGVEVPFTAEPLAPGKMRVTVDADPGLVFFGVSDDQGGLFEAGVSVPYSEEYTFSKPNKRLLEKIADRTDGELLEEGDDPTRVFRNHPFKSGEQTSIVEWLILTALLLFFIDITLRRFGLLKGITAKRRAEPVVEEPVREQDSISELLKAKKKR